MLQITPRQADASRRHKAFHQKIANRAALLRPREDRTHCIPNTPYGVPKIPPPLIVPISIHPAYSYCWCYDLVRFAERYETGKSVPIKRIQIRDIQIFVAEYYGVTVADILSSRRTKEVILPRHVGMYLAKTLTPNSLPEIGRRFAGRDHTSVLSAVRKISRLVRTDHRLQQEICDLADRLGGRVG